jgi:RNA polymerase sigma factor (sigma-70 family)
MWNGALMNGNYRNNQSAVASDEFGYQLLNLRESLRKFAYRLTSDYHDAGDLLQETLTRALEKQDKFTENTNLKAWTFTIMKNTFINGYRKNVKGHAIFDNKSDAYSLKQGRESGVETVPDSYIGEKEIGIEIEGLGDELKIPFMMHFEGYKYREIADALNLKIGTVKSRIFFARKNLIESLEGYS